MNDEGLLLEQRINEEQTVTRGIDRYRARLERTTKRDGFDKLNEVQRLIQTAVPILAEGIRQWLEETGKAKGRKPTSYTALSLIDPDAAAAIGTTTIFRTLSDGGRVASITSTIGGRVEIELEGAAVASKNFKAAQKFMKLAEGRKTTKALTERFKAMVAENEAGLHWSETTKVLVGQTILNIALMHLEDLFVAKTIVEKGKHKAVVELTDAAAVALATMQDAASIKHLPLRPMVVQPKPWVHMHSGAYMDYKLARLVPLVRIRTREARAAIADAISAGEMDEVLTAVNAIQDTRWTIDVRVLAIALWCRETGKKAGKGFPHNDLPEVPKKLKDDAWGSLSQDERTALSRKRTSALNIRKALGTNSQVFQDDMAEAIYLSTFEAFYMPHSLDFRGRTYAVPYFNHQRSDHMKGLFRFADAVPLGPTGSIWLMIHLANCGDFDKVSKKSFGDRLDWVADNEEKILQVAADPEGTYDWWKDADSPFCFLQACFEYGEWAASGFSLDFPSSIPGAADGSCSGLQHYSAITRSEEEAYHVNLLPRDVPGDIYQITADRATPTLQAAALGGDRAAELILANGFGRSQVKRNVMTYFYGSGKFGMRDQHVQDLMRPLADKVALGELKEHPYQMLTERTNKETGATVWQLDGGYTCAATLAAHTHAAVTSVAAKADEAARWIQTVAAVLAHEGLAMRWTVPTGLPVYMKYCEWHQTEVNLWLYDRSIKVAKGTDKVAGDGKVLSRVRVLIQQQPTPRVDKSGMRNASSPNVIHSMDAAHLHRSVAMAKAAGIDHFSMIHDSFGTHLGNMEKFGMIVREAFISIYENYCPLEAIDTYARSVLSEDGVKKLPPLPPKGTLDLSLLKEAKYAFA